MISVHCAGSAISRTYAWSAAVILELILRASLAWAAAWSVFSDESIVTVRPGWHQTKSGRSSTHWHRAYREEVLNAYLFDSMSEVREITERWIERYNEIRPHNALGSLPPARYREHLLAAETPV